MPALWSPLQLPPPQQPLDQRVRLLLIDFFITCQFYKFPMSLVLKNCGSQENKFIPLDMTKYEIYDRQITEIPNVIILDDDNMLSSICGMICSREDNTPPCIGFSSDVTTNRSCTLYSEIDVHTNMNTGPAMNVTGNVFLR